MEQEKCGSEFSLLAFERDRLFEDLGSQPMTSTELRRIVRAKVNWVLIFLIFQSASSLPGDKAADLVVAVALNGTFFLAKQGTVLWSFDSNRPIFSSYHHNYKYLDSHEDFGMSQDGEIIFSELSTTLQLFDEFGTLLLQMDSLEEGFDLGYKKDLEEHIYIVRKDYKLISICQLFSPACSLGQVTWTIGCTHIDCFHCQRWSELEKKPTCLRISVSYIPYHFQIWAPHALLSENPCLKQVLSHLPQPIADTCTQNPYKVLSHGESEVLGGYLIFMCMSVPFLLVISCLIYYCLKLKKGPSDEKSKLTVEETEGKKKKPKGRRRNKGRKNKVKNYTLNLEMLIRGRHQDQEITRSSLLEEIEKNVRLWEDNGHASIQLVYLMQSIVREIHHLHTRGNTHGHIKPQNIFIKMENGTLCAELSDGCGTPGEPEMSKEEPQTSSLDKSDMFCLGRVFYFCVTEGQHQYDAEPDFNTVDDQPEVQHLLRHLLQSDPDKRPNADQVLKHPIFWDASRRIAFLIAASERVNNADVNIDKKFLGEIESCYNLPARRWDRKFHQEFLKDMKKKRWYDYKLVKDLLRIMRNALVHFTDLSEDVQGILGNSEAERAEYFSSRFPDFLIKLYDFLLYGNFQGDAVIDKFKWK